MASSARIDELRKKFDENPRRYFAPLANEYRKAGDLEQAIFICQEYLPQQPGHMSGHIVYGQALFELQRHEEARGVFETALSLDPENLIALRHLGDIARTAGDTAAARIWYQRVLEADPRNEEIAQIMLELLDAAPHAEPPAHAPAPVDHSAPTPLSTPAVSSLAADLQSDLQADLDPPVEPATIGDPAPPMFEVEKAPDASLGVPTPEPIPRPAPPAAAEEDELLDLGNFDLGGVPLSQVRVSKAVPVQPEPMLETLENSETSDALEFSIDMPEATEAAESAEPVEATEPFEADPFAIAAAPDPAPAPEGLETFDAGGLHQTPPAAEMAIDTENFFELPITAPEPESEPESEPEPEPETVAAAEPAVEPVVEPTMEFAPEADPEPATEAPAPFVTETMATLYLEQGHLESAREIYQQLVAQRPEDMNLQERLRAIEERMFGAPAEPDSRGEPPVVAQAASYGGPTIRDFLTGLTSRRTPVVVDEIPAEELPTPDLPPERRPTPSSVETVSGSLGVLFSGADATASDTAAASTLAEAFQPEGPDTVPLQGVPAHRASSELSLDHVFKSGSPQRRAEDGDDFSFDQFFAGDAAEQPTAGDASPADAPTEGGDDIAQFNAWLNGLKKT